MGGYFMLLFLPWNLASQGYYWKFESYCQNMIIWLFHDVHASDSKSTCCSNTKKSIFANPIETFNGTPAKLSSRGKKHKRHPPKVNTVGVKAHSLKMNYSLKLKKLKKSSFQRMTISFFHSALDWFSNMKVCLCVCMSVCNT